MHIEFCAYKGFDMIAEFDNRGYFLTLIIC